MKILSPFHLSPLLRESGTTESVELSGLASSQRHPPSADGARSPTTTSSIHTTMANFSVALNVSAEVDVDSPLSPTLDLPDVLPVSESADTNGMCYPALSSTPLPSDVYLPPPSSEIAVLSTWSADDEASPKDSPPFDPGYMNLTAE